MDQGLERRYRGLLAEAAGLQDAVRDAGAAKPLARAGQRALTQCLSIRRLVAVLISATFFLPRKCEGLARDHKFVTKAKPGLSRL